MTRAAVALGWELAARHRWAFSAAALYLVAIAVAVPLLPEGWRWPGLTVLLSMPLGPIIPFLVAVLAHGYEAQLESTASTFPRRLYLLPAPAWLLAGVPLLLGSVVAVGGWLLFAACLARPCGVAAPLWWPGLLLAVLLAWVQALSWLPMPLSWLRPVLVPAPLVVSVFVAKAVSSAEVDEMALLTALTAALAAGYAAAVSGVARGRRGVGVGDEAAAGPVADIGEGYGRFRAPLAAQLWLEWRLQRWGVVAVTVAAVAVAVGSMHLFWVAMRAELFTNLTSGLGPTVEQLGPGWLALAYVFLVPWLLATVGATGSLGGSVHRRDDWGLSLFFATRPIATRDVIRAKLLVAALAVLFSSAVSLAAAFVWVACTDQLADMADRLSTAAGSPLRGLLALLGLVAALLVVSWLWLVRSFWVGLLGRPWVTVAVAMAVVCFWVIAPSTIAVHWVPQWWPFLAAGVPALLVAKAALVVTVIVLLHRRGLLRLGDLTLALAGWAAVAGAAGWLLSGNWLAVGVALLLLPLARCLAAPLALSTSRHR